MDINVLKQVEHYQKATTQQERDQLLYQIGLSAKLFTVRELNQVVEHGRKLSEGQRQRVLGYIEVYCNLDLD
jgi:ABC-type transport system involved in cytochrome bd biosynthesis fused ATPase/permease subunit